MYRHNWKAAERISTCMYEKIVDQLKDAGHERTVEQCRSKMKKLKQDYRKIYSRHAVTTKLDRKGRLGSFMMHWMQYLGQNPLHDHL